MVALALVRSRALAGLQAPEVVVEVHLAGGLPSFNIVGLAETEVKESRDRVRAALLNAQFEIPARRITVNLAPADLPKESGRFDLPIAIGILVASGQLPADRLDDYEYAGELSLSGQVRPIRGALAMTHALTREARERGETGRAVATRRPVGPSDARSASTARRAPDRSGSIDGSGTSIAIDANPPGSSIEPVDGCGAPPTGPTTGAVDAGPAFGTGDASRARDTGDACGVIDAGGTRDRSDTRDPDASAEADEEADPDQVRGCGTTPAFRSPRRGFVLPRESAVEAALCAAAEVYPVDDLLAVCAHLTGETPLVRQPQAPPTARVARGDFADVKGQRSARRALEVAAAGGHSVLMIGPPGTGKSMLAQRFPSLLPPMTTDEALESAAIASIADRFSIDRWGQRPYRAPHHTASGVALVGGGNVPRPGEISLAHHGVLFLDELPEFDRRVLEVLREPLESGHITISRAARQADFPARFQLLAAMNPCPCGYLGHPTRPCRCTSDGVKRYRDRISGPLLDRIDLQIEVAALTDDEIATASATEDSATIARRVAAAREVQMRRQGCANASLSAGAIDTRCAPDEAGARLLKQALARLGWSARAYHRVLKIARTIADLDGVATVAVHHVAEAIGYRRGLQEDG